MRRWFMPVAAVAVALAVGAAGASAGERGHDRKGGGRGKHVERVQPGPSYAHAPRHKRDYRRGFDRGHREWRHGHWRGHKRWHRRHARPDHGHWRRGVGPRHGKHTFARPCHPTRKIIHKGYGHRVIIGGLMCYDAFGRPYLAPGSRHVIRRF